MPQILMKISFSFSERTNKEILVRSCDLQALDNACSTFNFENDLYYGCLMSCHTHGCNVAPSILHSKSQTALTVISTVLFWTIAHRLGTPIWFGMIPIMEGWHQFHGGMTLVWWDDTFNDGMIQNSHHRECIVFCIVLKLNAYCHSFLGALLSSH